MHQYKELKVWRKAFDLTIEIYRVTESFPDKEKFGLISQINRSAVSIVSNIAEGSGRNSDKEFYNFLGFSLGSSCELETQLLIANRLNYISDENLKSLVSKIEEVQKMCYSLQKSFKKQYSETNY